MAGLEILSPVRQLARNSLRWRTNLGLTIAATFLLRVTLPIAAVGTALWAQSAGVGLFHIIEVPPLLSILIAIIALDALVYLQHRLMHRFDILWRLHKVHHADMALDVTTALRFHPLEIFLSMLLKMAFVAALGAPPLGVLIFEVLLNACAMFNHANLELGATANRILRRIIVTPDMHRSHHSVEPDEQNKNFGFNLSLWDRIFATYQEVDKADLAQMRLGLADCPEPKPNQFIWSLILPFLKIEPVKASHLSKGKAGEPL
ncbi:MAG: sterol desaturase family protein [Parvibaculum sp.]|nr:sterol desaturase family protein [Parvibaculum sp.]